MFSSFDRVDPSETPPKPADRRNPPEILARLVFDSFAFNTPHMCLSLLSPHKLTSSLSHRVFHPSFHFLHLSSLSLSLFPDSKPTCNTDSKKRKSKDFISIDLRIRSQRLENVVEQPTKHGTRITESFQNFRVKKSSTSLNNTSQISPVHEITPVLPTEEPEYSLSMSEYEVTSNDESECDVPVKDESSPVFPTFSNSIFDDNDDFTSSDDELLSNEDVPME
nr:hypothetical protein [Tanacetum cinerariifolium]